MPFDGSEKPHSALVRAAELQLARQYIGIRHEPSEAQWAAIRDLLSHLGRAAHRNLDHAVYVSAIPAGTGKTTAIRAFALSMVQDPAYANVGMLVAVNRKQEVKDLAAELADIRHAMCVICSDNDARGMGDHHEAGKAQVVISTQAALKETLRECQDFDRATRYLFHGRRRDVVVHDEAIAFNRPVVIGSTHLARLFGAVEAQSHASADALVQWRRAVAEHPGGICDVPDFEGMGVDLARLQQDADDDEVANLAWSLAVMSGGRGWVERDNRESSATLISHRPELPPSLLPIIVTDASAARGVHRAAYEQMSTQHPIRWLAEAPKTYHNLTIRVVPMAASRTAYKKLPQAKDLLTAAVTCARAAAPRDVLMVSYKSRFEFGSDRGRISLAKAVQGQLNATENRRVRHLHWGRHTATNEFKDCQVVILTGLYFVPKAAAHANSAAALNKPMQSSDPSDHPTPQQVADMKDGMLRDSTFQAVLRGNARLSLNGDCQPMEAVIFQARQSGLSDDDLRGMFPGATITEDRTLLPKKPLRGNLRRLSEIVMARLEAGETELTDQSLMASLKVTKGSFGKLKTKDEWRAWLTSMGLEQRRLSGGRVGIRRSQRSATGVLHS